MTFLSLVNKKLAIEVVLAQLFVVLAIVYFLFLRKKFVRIGEFFGKYGLVFAFLVSLGAIAGSLYYSQIAGFEPCELCWFQRICMYPLVVLLGMALIKKDRKITDYILALSGIGFVISLYHNYIYYYSGGLNLTCQLGGAAVSCVKRYVFELGYVTIPMMALTAFALIIIFMIFCKLYERSHQ